MHHHHADGTVHQGGIVPAHLTRWYAIKLFERDEKVTAELNLPEGIRKQIEQAIQECEQEMDDDAESIITNQRYAYISKLVSTLRAQGKAQGQPDHLGQDRPGGDQPLAGPAHLCGGDVPWCTTLPCGQHRHHRHRLYQ